jgi:putative glutamine amidotransferase
MRPRIAIPLPHSLQPEYAQRSIPQYERAVALAGGEPVRIPLDQNVVIVTGMIEDCGGILLPGSSADIDPRRFHSERSLHTAAPDPRRDAVDDILLEDAYRLRKPVLGICYGLQSLNVFRAGSLIQHIPDFLPEETRSKVNHEAGKDVAVAHTVEIEPGSKLAEMVTAALETNRGETNPEGFSSAAGAEALTKSEDAIAALEALRHPKTSLSQRHQEASFAQRQPQPIRSANDSTEGKLVKLVVPVNSSHHQSAHAIGKGLRMVARCPADGIIEALEGTDPNHFVVAVQWHPERSVDDDAASRSIFRALIEAASISR